MTETEIKLSWLEANQAYLVAQFTRLKRRLGGHGEDCPTELAEEVRAALETPAAIDRLSEIFGLSAFERDVLLLCAGVEMDSELAALCGSAQGLPQRAFATFGLAMAALADPHWSSLTPTRPLRHFCLVELEAGRGLTSAPLRIDERILHYLAGVNLLDARLEALARVSAFPDWIADGHRKIAAQAARLFESGCRVLHLCGDDPHGQEDVAALAARAIGRHLAAVRAEDLPAMGPEISQFIALWERESLLLPGMLLIECPAGGLTPSARQLVERLPGPLIVASREPVRINRGFLRLDVTKPAPAEQKQLWEKVLGPRAANYNGGLDALTQQFRLSARTIHSTAALAASDATTSKPSPLWGRGWPAAGALISRGEPGEGVATPTADVEASRDSADSSQADRLWNLCRSLARPRLEDLAQRVDSCASWDDLVLPEPQLRTLRQLAAQVRHRMKVYETWGFSAKGLRGLGVSALFSGESGTGKTMAAEVLARELALDLYRIDLSAVVSKYIGETEKNLKQVFDAAEEGGVLLLFDEADALFGKRSDVKDSHDRYANIEVSYLLQRMEAYQGLAILTTNSKSALDKSFQRRLRFTVNFPFPDAAQREAIWRRVFPATTPTQALDHARLAQLNVAGGNIRNIALNAAFLAAAAETPVQMEHVLQAARMEAQKIERPLSEAEIRGWV
ncbi:MAG: ATP-binding protein [Terriglobia bacterium]